jgi:alpha-amylase/alpha-mannosidase (GH57 family)
MASDRPIRLVLCWHMHQPDYRDLIRDEFQFPWVYLHAIKDYVDIAAHLEAHPGAKSVVNFSPILLEQLDTYERQFDGFLNHGQPLGDPLLAALVTPVFPADAGHRLALVESCLRANRRHMIERHAPFERLVRIADMVVREQDCGRYISNQYLADLVTWYHLAWCGETVQQSDRRVMELVKQGAGFTLHQRRVLLECIAELVASVRSRYRRLAASGQVELSTSPYAHPMVPLLLDFGAAREALPQVAMPLLEHYPGGAERARWHVQEGRRSFERYFGVSPAGCWPSEGGISGATLDVLAEAGFRWAASGETVLRNSAARVRPEADAAASIHAPWRWRDTSLRLFGRNDTLSDLIGFTYADWHAEDAVGDLIHRIEGMADAGHGAAPMVAIIMDGENAWEHYPRNGWYFLSTLYRRLQEHPRIELTTFGELAAAEAPATLGEIVSGSWIYGTFSTWIGDADKNHAWQVLGEVKRAVDEWCSVDGAEPSRRRLVVEQLASCEGSDWFWWFGDYNPAEAVRDFERLFRLHVTNLYQMLGVEAPQFLSETLAHGSGHPHRGGVMLPGAETRG